MRLIFATNNLHKINEIKNTIGSKYESFVYSLKDLNIDINPDENGNSFIDNANIKSISVYNYLNDNMMLFQNDIIIADDSGLCIDYFNGEPGIKSARFMGENTSQSEKNAKIIELMKDVKIENRGAYFITVLSVIDSECCKNGVISPLIFEGRVDGYISDKIDGNEGFGYDPIFGVGSPEDLRNNTAKTYASMGQIGKNAISHRSKAIKIFVAYLEKNHNI